MTKLEAKNIVKYFSHDSHKLKALGGINLKVEAGDFVCLVGPSGCGKSTFLRIVAGLEKPDEGQILFDGHNVTETGPERIMVFQEGALFPWLKVQDNVEFGLKMAGIPKEERAKISHRYLDMMQLTKFADSSLSLRVTVLVCILKLTLQHCSIFKKFIVTYRIL